jgi:predicted transcriptional regulator
MVRRHLTVAHGLNTDEYRNRWRLPAAHPLTAPEYSEKRASMAKLVGLGRNRDAAPASNAHTGAQEPVNDEPAASTGSAEAADD